MIRKRILITVKTYPALSTKYDELVCTAGLTEDGEWVRIYPIPFRRMDYEKRYAKYQWIELDLVRHSSDPRPESFRPVNYSQLIPGEKIDTARNWERRKEIVLQHVYTDLDSLISEAKDKSKCTSLAVLKPARILNFTAEETRREYKPQQLEKVKQGKLFGSGDNPFEVVDKLPYKFSYVFEDEKGKRAKLMIEDWEIGQLFWNCLKRKGTEELAIADVKKKYFDEFVGKKDLHFFLGTTRVYHFFAKNPFLIIGVFYPMKA